MGDVTQVELVRAAFFYSWAMQHNRWILLPYESSPDVAPNPVFMEFASNGVIRSAKTDSFPLFERRTLPYASKTRKGRNSVQDKPVLRKCSKTFFKTCLSR